MPGPSALVPILHRSGGIRNGALPKKYLERETGFEPATLSLEG